MVRQPGIEAGVGVKIGIRLDAMGQEVDFFALFADLLVIHVVDCSERNVSESHPFEPSTNPSHLAEKLRKVTGNLQVPLLHCQKVSVAPKTRK